MYLRRVVKEVSSVWNIMAEKKIAHIRKRKKSSFQKPIFEAKSKKRKSCLMNAVEHS